MKKKNLIPMLLTLFIVLLIGGFFNYTNKGSKQKELIIYKNNNGLPHDSNLLCCSTNEVYTKIKTETDNAKVLNVSEKGNYILIQDGKLKLLNTNTNELKVINLEPIYERYQLQTIGNDKLLGITYYKDNNYYETNHAGYYDLQTNKKLYEDKYSIIKAENEYYLIAINKDGEEFVLSSNEEKELFRNSNLDNNVKTSILVYKDKILLSKYIKKKNKYNLYNTNYDLLLENISLLSVKEDKIYTIQNDFLIIYNFELNKLIECDISNYNIEFITNQYAIFVNNDILFLLDLNTLVETRVYGLEKIYTFANTYQGYKKFGIHEENKNKEGIYIYLTKIENKEENKLDTLDKEILISEDLEINILELDGKRMKESEIGGIISE